MSELMNLLYLLERVIEADPVYLMKSRKHCHAEHVSSIVVDDNNGQLTRAFLAWPGHKLDRNVINDELTVGIHNHRYAIELLNIYGNACNTTYFSSAQGTLLNRWEFESDVAGGRPSATMCGRSFLKVNQTRYLPKEWCLKLQAYELHNIDCNGPAAWWVFEGKVVSTVTELYTKSNIIDTSGLYEPFSSREEVIEHVKEFIDYVGTVEPSCNDSTESIYRHNRIVQAENAAAIRIEPYEPDYYGFPGRHS